MLPNLIVPVLNRYDLLYKMVDSIDYPVDRLLIIENGGGQTSPDRYHTSYINDVDLVTLPSNLGVAGSWNLGIKLFPHDRVWFFTSNDVTFLPGGLANLAKAKPAELTLSLDPPHWQTFALGEDIVRRVGLFDERLYPAYFEDNDYINRIQIHGLGDAVTLADIASTHQNSSTLASSPVFQERNRHTFQANQKLYHQKIARADRSWSWDLDRRRAGEWLVD